MSDAFLPACFGTVFLLVVLLGFVLLMRYLNFKETMALAEKGLARPEPPTGGLNFLRWGIVLAALGLALTLGLWPAGFGWDTGYPLGLGPWMLAGFIPLFLGLGLVLVHYLTRRKDS